MDSKTRKLTTDCICNVDYVCVDKAYKTLIDKSYTKLEDKTYSTLKGMAILINADMTVASHMKLKANESKELMRSIYLRLNEMIGEEE